VASILPNAGQPLVLAGKVISMGYLQFFREAMYPLAMAACLSVAIIGIAIFAVTGATTALLFSAIYALGAGIVAIMPEDVPGKSL
jgi:hypothetical protein